MKKEILQINKAKTVSGAATRGMKLSKYVDNIQFLIMTIPTLIVLLLFDYAPMFGIVLAFKDYKVTKGIFGSEWCGFDNFKFFFQSQDAFRVIRNTVLLNFLFIFASIACGVAFALMMFEVVKRMHVKIYQTIAIMPSFLSWVVVGIIAYTLLDPGKGLVNQIIIFFGGEGISWYSTPEAWPVILLLTRLWHGIGLGSIIYYASLMGIDHSLFEAADIDGATKMQKIRFVSIPHLVPIVTIMAILDIGKIFRADFGLFYNVTLNAGQLLPTTDVIDTYVFRALTELGNVGMSSAVGFVQSVVCLIMILLTNYIVKRVSPENTLF